MHLEEAEVFNQSQELWDSLKGILTDEGYTSNETFDQAVSILRSLREESLALLEGDERDEFEKETRWVLNVKK